MHDLQRNLVPAGRTFRHARASICTGTEEVVEDKRW
jgi:hypothetical protein